MNVRVSIRIKKMLGIFSVLLLLGAVDMGVAQTTDQLSLTSMSSTSPVVSASNIAPIPSATNSHVANGDELFLPKNPYEDEAFHSVARNALPMTPSQVIKLKNMVAATQQAAATPVGTPPKPVTSSVFVNLSPGSSMPIIHLQQGFVSSLVFVDSSGNKWPVEGYDLGNPNAFNIQWQNGSNTMLVQAQSLYTYGNLAVKLKGMNTPVMLTLIPGQAVVDYRIDLHIEGLAPGVQVQSSSYSQSKNNKVLLNVLSAIAPKGATSLEVTGGTCDPVLNNCRAWLYKSQLYVRIPYNILSPGWVAEMQSSDGMKAYQLQKTPSLLVSVYGKTSQLTIEGY